MNFRNLSVLLVLLLFSCGSMRTSDLSERADNFNESLRWSSIKAAAAFMSESNKRTLMDQFAKEFQKNKIVEYSIVDVALDSTKRNGTVVVEFSYYDELNEVMHYRQDLQTWTLANNSWVIKDSRTVSQNQHDH